MKKLQIINVLSPEDYENCRIKGSINIPLKNLQEEAKNLDKNSTIVVHCAHYQCHAGRKAWKILHDLGFGENLYEYSGGIVEWKQKNYPAEGNCSIFAEELKNTYTLEPRTPEERDKKEVSAEELKKLLEEAGKLQEG